MHRRCGSKAISALLLEYVNYYKLYVYCVHDVGIEEELKAEKMKSQQQLNEIKQLKDNLKLKEDEVTSKL